MFKLLSLLILVMFASITRADTDARIVIGQFSAGKLTHWQKKYFSEPTHYELIIKDGQQVLQAISKQSASGLYRQQRIDLRKTPFLNWRWRIENRLDVINEQSKTGDDYAARVYIVIDGGLWFWNTIAINYVWAAATPKGTIWPNAFAGNNAMMLSLRSKADKTATWYTEKRHIANDLQRLHGKQFTHIDAVAIMTDTDNSGDQVTALYGDIYFSEH